MRSARVLLAATGVLAGLWGVWLLRDVRGEQLISLLTWLAGGVLLHDLVLGPVTVVLGLLAARVLPQYARAPAAIGFLVWATLTLTFANVLSGQGGKADNDTVLGRPYVLSWLVLTAVVVLVVAAAAALRRRAQSDPGAAGSS